MRELFAFLLGSGWVASILAILAMSILRAYAWVSKRRWVKKHHRKAEAELKAHDGGKPANVSLFPPDYFEPYAVCPACNAEALHWIHSPSAEEGVSADTKACRYWRGVNIVTPLRDFDVIRTCRSCDVRWGQNTGGIAPPPMLGPFRPTPLELSTQVHHNANGAPSDWDRMRDDMRVKAKRELRKQQLQERKKQFQEQRVLDAQILHATFQTPPAEVQTDEPLA